MHFFEYIVLKIDCTKSYETVIRYLNARYPSGLHWLSGRVPTPEYQPFDIDRESIFISFSLSQGSVICYRQSPEGHNRYGQVHSSGNTWAGKLCIPVSRLCQELYRLHVPYRDVLPMSEMVDMGNTEEESFFDHFQVEIDDRDAWSVFAQWIQSKPAWSKLGWGTLTDNINVEITPELEGLIAGHCRMCQKKRGGQGLFLTPFLGSRGLVAGVRKGDTGCLFCDSKHLRGGDKMIFKASELAEGIVG